MDDRPPSPPRRQRACVACAKARARCNFRQENIGRHLCDRCEKMGVECLAKSVRGLRRPRQIRDAGHVAAVRHEGDGLVRTAGNEPLPRANVSRAQPSGTDSNHGPQSNRSEQTTPTTPAPSTIPRPANAPLQQQPQRSSSSPLPFGLTWHQASLILHIFQTQHQPNFPFVAIPKETTAQTLYAERPFLFRTVMLVAAPLPEPRVEKMKRNTLAYLSHQMLVEEAKRLELLQGLLVVIAWAHRSHVGDEQVTNLVHLALGYAHTLGLTKVPFGVLERVEAKSAAQDVREKTQTMERGKTHSVEEQGALLGLYCLLSVNSIQHMRRNPLEGHYIEICCKTLTDNHPPPSRLLLGRIVRMTQMAETLSQAFGESHDRSAAKPYAYLLEGSGRTFRSDVNRIIETAMHPDLHTHHGFFKLWQHYLFVRLYEPTTRIKELEKEGIGPSMYRSLCLRNCFQAIQDYFEILLEEPATGVLYHTALASEQSAYVMLMSARTLLIDAPDWDVELARRTLDLVPILDQIIQRTEEAEAARKRAVENFAGETGLTVSKEEMNVESKLAETAKKTRWLKEGYQARLEGRTHRGIDLDEDRDMGAGGQRPEREPAVRWVNGMLAGSAWSFDDFATGYMLSQDSVTL